MGINNVSGTNAALPARASRPAAAAAPAAPTYAADSASFGRRPAEQPQADKPSALKGLLFRGGLAATFSGVGLLAAAAAAPFLELTAFLTPTMLFWGAIPTIAAGAVLAKVASD